MRSLYFTQIFYGESMGKSMENLWNISGYLLKLLKSIPDYLGAAEAEAAAWIACQFAKLVLREDVLPRLSDHDHLR